MPASCSTFFLVAAVTPEPVVDDEHPRLLRRAGAVVGQEALEDGVALLVLHGPGDDLCAGGGHEEPQRRGDGESECVHVFILPFGKSRGVVPRWACIIHRSRSGHGEFPPR